MPDLAATRPSAADPAMRDMLMELAAPGVRIARVAVNFAAADERVVDIQASGLPESFGETATVTG